MTPVVRSFSFPGEPGAAFVAFTQLIGLWWPKEFTVSGDRVTRVAIENGRVYERDVDGNEFDWGAVSNWEPGHRLVLRWTHGLRGAAASQVTVSFRERSDGEKGCLVSLEHAGWVDDGDRARFDDPRGWDVVLAAYQEFVRGHRS